ncbi:MAG: LysM peptidoglycan-binding domain-containing protein, partial [Microlunatus sp.]|nr:LysM peptidoglycan-binding domain-containing protein [Microlunatus sp.]
MRVIRGLAALLLLLGGVLAVPWALVSLVGNPLPSSVDWDALVGALSRPDDGSVLVGLVALLAWGAWVIFTLAVGAEVITLLSRHHVRIRVPGLAGAQRLASGLVVAVAALVVVSPQLSHARPAEPAVTPEGRSLTIADRAPQAEIARSGDAPSRHDPIRADRTQTGHDEKARFYTVRLGDDLWSLAERFYDDGREWRTIAAANPDRLSGGPDRLEAGWRLRIPGKGDTDGDPSRPTLRVRSGDTLSSIAERMYDDDEKWPKLYELNRFQLEDPDELEIGIDLVVPERSTKAASPKRTKTEGAGASTRARSGQTSSGGEDRGIDRDGPGENSSAGSGRAADRT